MCKLRCKPNGVGRRGVGNCAPYRLLSGISPLWGIRLLVVVLQHLLNRCSATPIARPFDEFPRCPHRRKARGAYHTSNACHVMSTSRFWQGYSHIPALKASMVRASPWCANP